MSKTLREAMGLRDSIGNISVGDTVRIKANGRTGRVDAISKHGLLAIRGCCGVYTMPEVELVEKEKFVPCPNIEKNSKICPGIKETLHPEPTECRFVKVAGSIRLWLA
ncbi:MAG: hypothetical protein HPY74_19340 [Firmicutes bacterium]|nr:hypothetical protein [Bacillota bacterium]